MFDLGALFIPITAAVLFGIAITCACYSLGRQLQRHLKSAATLPRESQYRGQGKDVKRTGFAGMMLSVLPVFVGLGQLTTLGSVRASLVERYARAGWPGGLEDDEIYGAGMLFGVLLALPIVLLVGLFVPLLAPLSLAVVPLGPVFLSANMNSRGVARELAISRTMPFVLDLLVLTMRAGASLPQALGRVALDHARHPVGAEFNAILADLDMGVTTTEAFENLASRVPIDTVKTFVDDLVGAEELGRPLADTFERQAEHARVRRLQEATDTAGRAKVLVLVPGMLVFLAALLLLFAPFVVRFFYGGYAT